jgi:hypothetical protein
MGYLTRQKFRDRRLSPAWPPGRYFESLLASSPQA